MKPADKNLLLAIAESEPATFADISIRTRMATIYLGSRLDDLLNRGFIRMEGPKYFLSTGVLEHINIERSAVNI